MGKNIRKVVPAMGLLLAVVAFSPSPAMAAQVGVWQFNGNLNNGQPGGAPMSVAGVWTPTYVNEMIGGSPAMQLSFPKFGISQALDMPNQAGGNGPSAPGSPPTTNNWSIVMDVRFSNFGLFTSLWQAGALTGDADYFIRDDTAVSGNIGIGVTNQYGGNFTPSDWTRIAVTVDSVVAAGTYTVTGYINGVATGVVATTDASPGGKEAIEDFLHLFADNGPGFTETSDGYVNSVAYYGEVLSAGAIGALGGASAAGIPVAAPGGAQVGVWNFNDNLNNAHSGGAPMSVLGGWTPGYVDETIGGSTARVLSFAAMDFDQALDMPNEADRDDPGDPPGDPPTTTNIWSIVMDVRFPSAGNYTSLWQAGAIDGGTDGDYFVRDTEGIGISGDYDGTYTPSNWTRIAVTVDSPVAGGGYKLLGYIDGVPVEVAPDTAGTTPDGKEAIAAFLHLFNDGDGDFETSAGIVNSIAFYDVVLTPAEIAALGGATAAGIPAVIPPGVPGDYNNNFTVDAADYVVWRKYEGTTNVLPNDPIGGTIGSAQYDRWRANFGMTAPGSGSGSTLQGVPEPATFVLLVLIAPLVALRRIK